MSNGLAFSGCTGIDSEPDSSNPSNLEAIQSLSKVDPNLIRLEATVTDSFGEENTLNENSRGAASDRARFNIDIKYIVEPTERQKEVFQAAVDRWERIIIADEENLTGATIPSAFPNLPTLVNPDQVLDDIIIEVNLREIDGPSGVLGRAGPRYLRVPDFTTISGMMEFDVADLEMLDEQGQFENVIIHEMGHVLGIDTFWRLSDSGFDTPNLINLSTYDQLIDPDYLGNTGNLFWKTEGGEGLLPVEGTFFYSDGTPYIRSGTSYSHWDEDRLYNELMTGFLNSGVDNVLSRITAGSVRDLGYGTANVGEPYSLPVPSETARNLRTSEEGINIAEAEELLSPVGFVLVKK